MATIDLGKIKPVWKGTWAGSTAYEKNDMIAQGVNSYICTAAHTSDASTFSNDSANWDVMATGADMPAQSGQSGKYLTTNGTDLSWGTVPSTVRKISHRRDGTRRTFASANNQTNVMNFSFTKDYDENTTDILITGHVPLQEDADDALSWYININSTAGVSDNYVGMQGVWYQAGIGNHGGEVTINRLLEGLGQGTHTIYLGWKQFGSTSSSPGPINPNNADDSRLSQMYSAFTIWEIEQATVI